MRKNRKTFSAIDINEIDELKFIGVVCRPEVEQQVLDRLYVLGGRIFFSGSGEGISKNKKMEMLGIQTVNNIVIFATARNEDAKNILIALDAEFNFTAPGNGLGFVVDVDGFFGAKGLFIK